MLIQNAAPIFEMDCTSSVIVHMHRSLIADEGTHLHVSDSCKPLQSQIQEYSEIMKTSELRFSPLCHLCFMSSVYSPMICVSCRAGGICTWVCCPTERVTKAHHARVC